MVMVISVDPGVSGGICVLKHNFPFVFHIPTEAVIVNKKKKKRYDVGKIVEILEPYTNCKNTKILFVQESVGTFGKKEGTVSSFSFGRSAGITEGIAKTLHFIYREVRPSVWKKHFPQLETEFIKSLREEMKELRRINKTIEGKREKDGNKKAREKLARRIKSESKNEARKLASELYPDLADNFKKPSDDGVAEALLIALYGRDNYNELV